MSKPESQRTNLAPGVVVQARYRLNELVARGGMGTVWAATDLGLERPVALKFMDPRVAASPDLRARFEREAKAAAKLRTPHVVQVFDHGLEGSTPYIVMELLEGEDLGARLRRRRSLEVHEVASMITQAAKALRRAHEAGILHRDLKPQNVYLARSDDEEIVKLLDFGIAKFSDPPDGKSPAGESTRTGELLGSPHYMSPEQARGLREIDHRSDLWSLSIIAYRALTGSQPFRGEGIGDVIYRICTESVPPPSSIAPTLPPALDAFFERALARDPADRFQSAMELAAAFAAASGSSVSEVANRPSMPSDVGEASRPAPSPPGATPTSPPTPMPSGTLTTTASDATPPPPRPLPSRVLWFAAAAAFGGILAIGIAGLRWRSDSKHDEATRAAARSASEGAASEAAPSADVPSVASTPADAPPPSPPADSAIATASATAPGAVESAPRAVASAAPVAATRATSVAPPATASAKAKKKTDWGY